MESTKMKLEDHIAVFEHALNADVCAFFINYFDIRKQLGQTRHRSQMTEKRKTVIDDETLFLMADIELLTAQPQPVRDVINTLKTKYDEYLDHYTILRESTAPLSVFSMRLQKTEVGGGYHIWHYENSHPDACRRLVAFSFYLNDVQEGGETEFLYQHKRFKATTGTLVIWPSTFTHTHRGNPPLSNDKYIITGWLEF